MRSVYNFVVEPKGERYNNSKMVGDTELILNTEIFNHKYVNREAIVKSTPIALETEIKPGDTVIVHHNVFRRWHNQHGEEKNSTSYFDDNTYILTEGQIFAYKRKDKWKPLKGYCFIKPIKETDKFSTDDEKLIGIVKHSDGTVCKGDLVGFDSISQYEFVMDGERLYRIESNKIKIKYEYQGNEEEYNPSWA